MRLLYLLAICCWDLVAEANGQFSLTQRKIAARLVAMTHEASILVLERTHKDIFRQRMHREEIEPSEKLIIEALDELEELSSKERQHIDDLRQTGWWQTLLTRTTDKLLTLGLKIKLSRTRKKSRILTEGERPPLSEMSEETFVMLMGNIEKQKHHTKARFTQFQQATNDPEEINYDALSHENFFRLYLGQLSEQELETLIKHLDDQPQSTPKEHRR